LLSRYCLLSELQRQGLGNVTVFCHQRDHVKGLGVTALPNGRLYNLIPSARGWRALVRARAVLWTGGLDLQDDSSLAKLAHTLLLFTTYRAMGLKIIALMQGAGPLETSLGRVLARLVLNRVSLFIARDSGTFRLVQSLKPSCEIWRGSDGIFCGEPERRLGLDNRPTLSSPLKPPGGGRPLIALNIRRWFHFSSSILPYHLAKGSYVKRSEQKMLELLEASKVLAAGLRKEFDARLLLVSMYEPGLEPWEDDLPFLGRVKESFRDDPEVVLVDRPLELGRFWAMLQDLDLMIGMRLHSCLAAWRLGRPAINLSYTIKGDDICRDLGLEPYVLRVEDFIEAPRKALKLAYRALEANTTLSQQIAGRVAEVVAANNLLISRLIARYNLTG
jgi:hypothetical protein